MSQFMPMIMDVRATQVNAIAVIPARRKGGVSRRSLVFIPDLNDDKIVPTPARITIHDSCFPAARRNDLFNCLRNRTIAPKFLYESARQSEKWLELFQAYSPFSRDPSVRKKYRDCFKTAAKLVPRRKPIHLFSIGCGSGDKDLSFVKALAQQKHRIRYSPCDISQTLALTAFLKIESKFPTVGREPLIADASAAWDLASWPTADPRRVSRLIIFLGLSPNLAPQTVIKILRSLLVPGDFLLFSANLAPSENTGRERRPILRLYDNARTRDWLMTFLVDLGIPRRAGQLQFEIEHSKPFGLLRVAAYFTLKKAVAVSVLNKRFRFRAGERIQLFFSYRYRPVQVSAILGSAQIEVLKYWITGPGGDGLFLCRRKPIANSQ